MCSTVGGVQYCGGVHYHGGYHDKCGDILSTVGVILSTMGDIMMHVGGYHEYHRGCSVPWEILSKYLKNP